MKVKIEIKSIFGKVLFSYESEDNTIAKTVTEAVKTDANLSGANLRGADLRGANLIRADLSGADLSGADLSGADLIHAYLRGANLRGANLRGANLIRADLSGADLRGANLIRADLRGANLIHAYLSGANLRGADLRGANLIRADLSGADLSGADLRGADLRGADLIRADLSDIKNDFWDILLRAQKEISALKSAVQDGKINGSVYSGKCACLVGTIANIRHCDYHDLGTITPDTSRPIERFFLGLKEGDTPENSQISKIVLEWIEEFQTLINNQ